MNEVNKITLQQQLERDRLIKNALKKDMIENYARIQAAREKARLAAQNAATQKAVEKEAEKENILVREAMANEQLRSAKLQEKLLKQSANIDERKIKAVQKAEPSKSDTQGETPETPYKRQNTNIKSQQEFKLIDVDEKIEEIRQKMQEKYKLEGQQKIERIMAEINGKVEEIEKQRKLKEVNSQILKTDERKISQAVRTKENKKDIKPKETMKDKLLGKVRIFADKLEEARKILGETPKKDIQKTKKKLIKVKKKINIGIRASKIQRNLSRISVSISKIIEQAKQKAKKEEAIRKKREQTRIPQQSVYTRPIRPTSEFERNRNITNYRTYGAIQSYRNNMKFYNDNKYILEEAQKSRRSNKELINNGVIYDRYNNKQNFKNRVRTSNIDHEKAIREYRARQQQRKQNYRARYI